MGMIERIVSKADIKFRKLSRARACARSSAIGGKADINGSREKSPLMTQSGHSMLNQKQAIRKVVFRTSPRLPVWGQNPQGCADKPARARLHHTDLVYAIVSKYMFAYGKGRL